VGDRLRPHRELAIVGSVPLDQVRLATVRVDPEAHEVRLVAPPHALGTMTPDTARALGEALVEAAERAERGA